MYSQHVRVFAIASPAAVVDTFPNLAAQLQAWDHKIPMDLWKERALELEPLGRRSWNP